MVTDSKSHSKQVWHRTLYSLNCHPVQEFPGALLAPAPAEASPEGQQEEDQHAGARQSLQLQHQPDPAAPAAASDWQANHSSNLTSSGNQFAPGPGLWPLRHKAKYTGHVSPLLESSHSSLESRSIRYPIGLRRNVY